MPTCNPISITTTDLVGRNNYWKLFLILLMSGVLAAWTSLFITTLTYHFYLGLTLSSIFALIAQMIEDAAHAEKVKNVIQDINLIIGRQGYLLTARGEQLVLISKSGGNFEQPLQLRVTYENYRVIDAAVTLKR